MRCIPRTRPPTQRRCCRSSTRPRRLRPKTRRRNNMALYPRIESPCPYKGNLADIMDGDVCRLCKREVFDLTAMGDAERVAFMKGCAGEVCVSYRMPMRTALA